MELFYLLFNSTHRPKEGRLKVHVIRYADDFVITGRSSELLDQAKTEVAAFLAERSLTFSPEKTKITQTRTKCVRQSPWSIDGHALGSGGRGFARWGNEFAKRRGHRFAKSAGS
jgi:hypothetical protein